MIDSDPFFIQKKTSDTLHYWHYEKVEKVNGFYSSSLSGMLVAAQDVTEEEEAADEDTTDDVIAEDEDDEAEVEDDENTELVRA